MSELEVDNICHVCGGECRYGERHSQCVAAVLSAKAPLLAEIERLRNERDEARARALQWESESGQKWQRALDAESTRDELRAQLEAANRQLEEIGQAVIDALPNMPESPLKSQILAFLAVARVENP